MEHLEKTVTESGLKGVAMVYIDGEDQTWLSMWVEDQELCYRLAIECDSLRESIVGSSE